MDEKRFVRLFWIAKAILLIVLVYGGFEVATSRLDLGAVLDPGAACGQPRETEDPVARPAAPAPTDYTAIVGSNLFGTAPAPPTPPPDGNRPQAAEPLPSAESLGLTLVGTVAGGPITSRAIIQTGKNGTAGPYRIGDTVAGATVEAIQRDAVVLRHQGRPLVLKPGAGKASDKVLKAEAVEQRAVSQEPPPSPGRSPLLDPSTAGYVAEVFRQATIEPYTKNQRTEGLKITGLDKFPMAALFGLKDGDIIQAINGQQLTSKQKAFQVLMKARTQPKVNLQLLRDGKSRELSFDL